jgi:hydrogenase maturation protease
MMKFPGKGGKTCIVGIGNTLRGDDGAGPCLCSHMAIMNPPGLTILTVQQLNIELIEEFLTYDCVILADAAIIGGEVEFYKLTMTKGNTEEISSFHYTNAQMLNALAKKLYGRRLPLFICTIRGEDFGVGDTLSPRAIGNIDTAVQILCDWINDRPIRLLERS